MLRMSNTRSDSPLRAAASARIASRKRSQPASGYHAPGTMIPLTSARSAAASFPSALWYASAPYAVRAQLRASFMKAPLIMGLVSAGGVMDGPPAMKSWVGAGDPVLVVRGCQVCARARDEHVAGDGREHACLV